MKKSVTVNVNEKKLSAIEMYLEQKNTTLAAELEKYVESLRESRRSLLLPNLKSIPSSNSLQFAPCRLVWRFQSMGGGTLP